MKIKEKLMKANRTKIQTNIFTGLYIAISDLHLKQKNKIK